MNAVLVERLSGRERPLRPMPSPAELARGSVVDPRAVALCRVMVGTAALLLAPVETVWLWRLGALLFAVGFLTRLSGGLLVALVGYQLAVHAIAPPPQAYLFGLLLLLLGLADSGAVFSVDARLWGRTKEWVPRWPIVALRVTISLAYVLAALARFGSSVASWPSLAGMSLAIAPLPDGATIAAALFLALALWSRRLQGWAFLAGLMVHIVAPAAMGAQSEVVLFGIIPVATYVLFLDERDKPRLVIWDDQCSFCRSSVTWLRRLDWLRWHRIEGSSRPEALAEAGITVQEADEELKLRFNGKTLGGFDAVSQIATVLPATFLWAKLLRLPGVVQIGRRLYRAVARRRKCTFTPRAAT